MRRRSFMTLSAAQVALLLPALVAPVKGETTLPATDAIPTLFVSSADGTRIAYNRLGQGPALIILAGLLSDRRRLQGLADELAKSFTVIHFDRRGRGESGDTLPYAVEREVQDIAALIAAVGGTASVYGHSSGAGLAAHAAAAGLPIYRLVLHEPPFGPDDESSKAGARDFATGIQALISEGRHAEAIETFMAGAGVPPEMIEGMISDPETLKMAPTMLYDIEIMGEIHRGGAIPVDLIRAIKQPTLVLAGSASPPFFLDTAEAIAGLLPQGRLQTLPDADHGAPGEVVAPAVAAFVLGDR